MRCMKRLTVTELPEKRSRPSLSEYARRTGVPNRIGPNGAALSPIRNTSYPRSSRFILPIKSLKAASMIDPGFPPTVSSKARPSSGRGSRRRWWDHPGHSGLMILTSFTSLKIRSLASVFVSPHTFSPLSVFSETGVFPISLHDAHEGF